MTRVSPHVTNLTAVALFALWGASWMLSTMDLGSWALPLALAIAVAKGALVVLFFMEIVLEKTAVHATLVTGLAMIAILVFFMIADVKTRSVPLLPPVEPHGALGVTGAKG